MLANRRAYIGEGGLNVGFYGILRFLGRNFSYQVPNKFFIFLSFAARSSINYRARKLRANDLILSTNMLVVQNVVLILFTDISKAQGSGRRFANNRTLLPALPDEEAEMLSLPTNPKGSPMLPFDWLIHSGLILARCHGVATKILESSGCNFLFYLTSKGPSRRGHIVADTLLPTQMFPRLPPRATFVADTKCF